jgi:hypothetical protein
MHRTLTLALAGQLVAASLSAQDEATLRSSFEGKTVVVKLAMPAAEAGVDLYPEAQPPVDYPEHAKRLKKYGVAIQAGQPALVTKLKVKGKLVEFQLDGGGYGTAGDPTDPNVGVAAVPKTQREKDLEDAVKKETDPAIKRRIEAELDQLRSDREREDQRNRAIAASATERRREYLQERRLQGGSRFNLRYPEGVPPEALRVEAVTAALADFVDFEAPAAAAPAPTPADTAPTQAEPAGPLALRKGLLADEVDQLLGEPFRRTSRKEGRLVVTTRIYDTKAGRVVAEFVEDVLFRYAITSR